MDKELTYGDVQSIVNALSAKTPPSKQDWDKIEADKVTFSIEVNGEHLFSRTDGENASFYKQGILIESKEALEKGLHLANTLKDLFEYRLASRTDL